MSAREFNVERWAILYARIALGAAFLSGIADRFGLWGKNVGYGDFAHFMQYTAQVNSFMPAFTIPFLAWRSEEHTSELQSHLNLVCRLLLEKKKYSTTADSMVLTCES